MLALTQRTPRSQVHQRTFRRQAEQGDRTAAAIGRAHHAGDRPGGDRARAPEPDSARRCWVAATEDPRSWGCWPQRRQSATRGKAAPRYRASFKGRATFLPTFRVGLTPTPTCLPGKVDTPKADVAPEGN